MVVPFPVRLELWRTIFRVVTCVIYVAHVTDSEFFCLLTLLPELVEVLTMAS